MLRKIAFAAALIVPTMFVQSAMATTCPSLTSITNGTTADATPVGNNFTSLLTCANTSLAPLAAPHFTGNVGIGTTNPIYNLVISNGGAEGLEIAPGSGGGIDSLQFYNRSGGSYDTVRLIAGSYQFFRASTELARIDASGNVGIGTATPSYLLTVNGTAYASGAAGALSDRRHKKDIQPFAGGGLSLVMQLKPVTFLWKDPKDDGMRGRQIGFIAQDVMPVLPDVVLTMNDADKTLGLKYDGFIPVLTKAIQEQQAQIETLVAANRAQAADIRRLQTQMSALLRRNGIRTAAK